jgi:S1-C subfamily serine protease
MADELALPAQRATDRAENALSVPPAPPEPPPVIAQRSTHPLDRSDVDLHHLGAETARIRLAWAKLIWLLSFLAVLLGISYLVPYIAEQTQYAITRGKQRAEHDFAIEHVAGSPLGDVSRAYQMVSQVVGPSVVHINTLGTDSQILPLSMGRRTRVPSEGQGSGIIIDASGYILTNNHVVRHSHEIDVSLADGRKVKAQVVGQDEVTDLAVLKVTADKLTPATWGDSEVLEPGALVWAVGSPFGLERTITAGILSAKHRSGLSRSSTQDFLQTDAAVNPGNSGGPLVDSQGRVIGINTAIVGESYQGISFAIPSNVARDIYTRLKTEKVVRRGWLGVELAEVTAEQARQLGLVSPTGVYIAGIFQQTDGSPAARAGIQAGDIIRRWNDLAVNVPADLSRLVAKTPIGSRAKATIYRSGEELTLEVVVGERPTQLD